MSETRLINAEQGERICEQLALIAGDSYTIDPSATSSQLISQAQGEKIITQLENIIDKSWATAKTSTIVSMVAAADAGMLNLDDYWSIGDERSVKLNAIPAGDYNVAHAEQTAILVLMGKQSFDLTTPVPSGTKCHFSVGFKSVLLEGEKMELTQTNENGWANSRGRKCCDAIFNMIPEDLQPIFKKFKVVTAVRGGSAADSTTTYDQGKLSLFAEKEIFGSRKYSVQAEADSLSQIEYYSVSANRIKRWGNDGDPAVWWERSPGSDTSTTFCCVRTIGTEDSLGVTSPYGFAPFGCI